MDLQLWGSSERCLQQFVKCGGCCAGYSDENMAVTVNLKTL